MNISFRDFEFNRVDLYDKWRRATLPVRLFNNETHINKSEKGFFYLCSVKLKSREVF